MAWWCSRRASQSQLTRRGPHHSCVVGHQHSCGTGQADTKSGSLLHERRRKGKGCKAANGCAPPRLQRLYNFFTAYGLWSSGHWREAGDQDCSPVPCGCAAIQSSYWLLAPCQSRHRGCGWGGCRQNNQNGNQRCSPTPFSPLLPHLLAPVNTKPRYTSAAQVITSLCPAV